MNVSVIIPCKNEVKQLPLLLDSLRQQTIAPNEVVVVDSNCTDDTIAIAKQYRDTLPIHIATATGPGVAAARNTGALRAKGEMFLFTDADSILPPKIIETLTAEITNRELDAGGFTQRMPSKRRGISFGARLMNGYLRLMQHTPWPIAFGSCLFVTKQAFTEMKGFDTTLFIMEDYDLIYRIKKYGKRVGIISTQPFIGSDRRFTSERPHSIWRGVYAELYRYTHGMRVDKQLFRYDMGGQSKEGEK